MKDPAGAPSGAMQRMDCGIALLAMTRVNPKLAVYTAESLHQDTAAVDALWCATALHSESAAAGQEAVNAITDADLKTTASVALIVLEVKKKRVTPAEGAARLGPSFPPSRRSRTSRCGSSC